MLMNALSPLVNIDKMQEIMDSYGDIFNKVYLQILLDKDTELISTLFAFMQNQRIDYTYFFRTLSNYTGDRTKLLSICMMKKPLEEWLDIYDTRLKLESRSTEDRVKAMLKYVLKNYMLQEAIDKANEGDFSGVVLHNVNELPA